MKLKVFLLLFVSIFSFSAFSQSSNSLNLKINTQLMDVEVFGDSVFSVDVYFNYAAFQGVDSLKYELIDNGIVISSKTIPFQDGYELRIIGSSNKAVLRLGEVPIKEYQLIMTLFENGNTITEDKNFGY